MANLLVFSDGFEVELPTYEYDEPKDIEKATYGNIFSEIDIAFAPQMFTDSELKQLNKDLQEATGFDNFALYTDESLCSYQYEFFPNKEAYRFYEKSELAWFESEARETMSKVITTACIRHALNQPLD